MDISTTFRDELMAALPHLRAFANSLVGNPALADDLVQDTVVRCWSRCHQFEPGTSFMGWSFTVLRNLFYSQYRRRRREVEDVDGIFAATLVSLPDQETAIEVSELRRALDRLPPHQKEALILVAAEDLSCAEAARIMGCSEGTVKSRVSRGRDALVALLGADDRRHRKPDSEPRAARPRVRRDRPEMALATSARHGADAGRAAAVN